jgi:hypothetical protein
MVELASGTTQLKLKIIREPSRRAYSRSTTSPITSRFLSRPFISGVTGGRVPMRSGVAGTSGSTPETSIDGLWTARLPHLGSGSSPTPQSAVCAKTGRVWLEEVR